MTRERPMGTAVHADGHWTLRFERRLRHPPEKVWRALTESEHLQHWMPADIVGERRAGAPIELPFWPAQVERYRIEQPVLHGEIRVWEPPEVFEWTWDVDLLRWELRAEGEGTVLTFTTRLGEPSAEHPVNTAAGYHVCLDQLIELLDTGSVGPLEDADVSELEQRYGEALSAG